MGHFIDATLRFVDQFTKPMQNAMSSLENGAKQYVRAGRDIQKAGKGIERAGDTLIKGVTVPIIGVGIASVKTAADFEKSMSKVQSICGASESELVQLTAKAQEMGAKTKFSASESADAFSYMAMAGWDAKAMMDGIEGIMYLAGATGEDLAATSDIVTDALTAFGYGADQTTRFVDVMAQAANRSNTDVAKMGETFQYVAPVAGALGYSVEDTAVAIGLMANSGIKASNAGTALRSMFTNLAKPTDSIEAAMKKLGIGLTDSKGEMKSLSTLMSEMRGAFSGLTEAEKAQYAATIAGKTGMSGLLAIVNASDSDFESLTKSMQQSNGAAKAMYDVANDNLSGQLTILSSTLESIGISLGNKMLPYVKQGVEWLQGLAETINNLNSEQFDAIIKWGAFAAALPVGIKAFGTATTGIGKCVEGLGKFGKQIPTIKKNFAAAGKILETIKLPTANFGKLGSVFSNTFGKMGGVLSGVGSKFSFLLKPFNSFFGIFGKFTGKLFAPITKLGGVFGTVGKAMFTALGPAGSVVLILAAIVAAGILVYKNWDKIKAAAKQLGDRIKTAFENSGINVEGFKNAIAAMGEKVGVIVGKLKETFATIATALQPALSFIGNTFFNGIKVYFSGIVGFGAGMLKGLMGVVDGALTAFGGLLDFIKNVFCGNWKGAFEGLKTFFSGWGTAVVALVKTPINAIIGLINGAIDGINSLGLDIPDWVPHFGGKSFSINVPTIPMLYKGTENWKGGTAMVHDRGAEIIDLPSGTRVIPHDKSLQEARKMGTKKTTVTIAKLADQIVVREEADIDKLADKLADKLEEVVNNKGAA